jgi:hypothetical protein
MCVISCSSIYRFPFYVCFWTSLDPVCVSFEESELLLNAPSADVSIDVRSQIISRHREKTVPFILCLGLAVFCVFYLIDYFVCSIRFVVVNLRA